jgi:hypothetical protein
MLSRNMMLCLSCFVAAQSGLMLSPDMAFHFVCKEAPRGDIERGMDDFLRGVGFKVLNVADVQRQRDGDISDTNMVA